MKILHVYRTYFPDTQGGLEEVIRQICLSTKSHQMESRIFCLSRNPSPKQIERQEGRVMRRRLDLEIASCGMSLSALRTYSDAARWADVVHYHFPWPFADILHLTSTVKRPSVLTYHSDIVRQHLLNTLYKPVMYRFLKSVDSIACTSPNYFATSEVLNKVESKVSVIPIGISESSYPIASKAVEDSVLKKYGRDYFLFVGVLRYYKGLQILLDAITNAPFRVVIAGSGPTEQELKKQAATLKLTNVIFAGSVSDEEKTAMMRHCRAVVFPSYLRSEAFGVTLLEGAMHSKPLISTEIGSGTSHVNIDQKTGIVVLPGSARALRRAMDKLYSDAELSSSMGKNARDRFLAHFTADRMGDRYANEYRKVTSAADPTHIKTEDH